MRRATSVGPVVSDSRCETEMSVSDSESRLCDAAENTIKQEGSLLPEIKILQWIVARGSQPDLLPFTGKIEESAAVKTPKAYLDEYFRRFSVMDKLCFKATNENNLKTLNSKLTLEKTLCRNPLE